MNINDEIIKLAEEILTDIELDRIPLVSIVLKCSRLARLAKNSKAIELFGYEMSGYPQDASGFVLSEAFELARHVNRVSWGNDKSRTREYIFPETVAQLESMIVASSEQLKVANDPNTSLTSANPNQILYAPTGNHLERESVKSKIVEDTKKLNQLKSGYYKYVLDVLYQFKFEGIIENIFEKKRRYVDQFLEARFPDLMKKFVVAYENLKSENSENWANAVHECRRILKGIADLVYPADNRVINVGNGKSITLNEEMYIARIKEFLKQKAGSKTFQKLFGSDLEFLSDRLDAIYDASNKGSHDVVTKDEAERYVIGTYMVLADLLPLAEKA